MYVRAACACTVRVRMMCVCVCVVSCTRQHFKSEGGVSEQEQGNGRGGFIRDQSRASAAVSANDELASLCFHAERASCAL